MARIQCVFFTDTGITISLHTEVFFEAGTESPTPLTLRQRCCPAHGSSLTMFTLRLNVFLVPMALPRTSILPVGKLSHAGDRFGWFALYGILLLLLQPLLHGGVQNQASRGWRNTVGNLIDIFWLNKTYHGPQFTGICVKRRGVRFHRIRDFKQYYFNSTPPTSQVWNRISRRGAKTTRNCWPSRAWLLKPEQCSATSIRT